MTKKIISYAQNLEDVMLYRIFSGLEAGFYIDIGACDPFLDSVTLAFYNLGWSGINVEPTVGFYQQLSKHRPRDINLNLAISDSDKTIEFVTVEDAGISSVDSEVFRKANHLGYKATSNQVTAISLRTLVERHCRNREVHFLKIDVEGHEAQVITGADWSVFRPWVLVIEAVSDSAQVRREAPDWDQRLLDSGYLFAWFDGLNRFYVRQESAHLLAHFDRPINIFDQFTLPQTHPWVHSPSMTRRMASKLLPAEIKATIRRGMAGLLGSKLR